MGKAAGKLVPLSPFRRLVTDLMYLSQRVPSVTAERRMDLAAVAAARQGCAFRPAWAVLFTKAYALAARDYPALRQAYLEFPWPRLYEHPHHVATVNIERELPGERVVLYCLIRSPENRSLQELDGMVRYHKETPVEQLRSYRRAVAMSRIPWPFRRWFWSVALNLSGRRRSHNFGTFGLTSVGAQGAGLLKLIPLLTSSVHYGMFDAQSCVEVRLSWDHRVLDGATIARVLVDLERILNHEIVAELREMQVARAA
jgi:pyruvate/2-oxoglutarate dehydrogenase complex dihydrolipoamide acyltransferase (E2) component